MKTVHYVSGKQIHMLEMIAFKNNSNKQMNRN